MTLLSPWWLLGVIPVAMAAAWALWRPGRDPLTVPSLTLWHAAMDALASRGHRARRRLSLSWLCLLAGAMVAVLALAQPVWTRQGPQRRIAIGVVPSYELATSDPVEKPWLEPCEALLARLGPNDRVQVLRPALLGGATDWLSVSDARDELARLLLLPALADDLPLPPPAPDAQRTVIFRYQADPPQPAPTRDVIGLLGDAFPGGATALDARKTQAGDVRVFVGLPTATSSGTVTAGLDRRDPVAAVDAEAGNSTTLIMPASPYYHVVVNGSAAYLAAVPRPSVTLALAGTASEALRRYVQSDDLLRLTANAAEADIVIACGVEPAGRQPALVLDPPSPPDRYASGELRRSVLLAEADVDTDHPIMDGVDVAGMALRVARPYRAVEGIAPSAAMLTEEVLMALDGQVLALAQRGGPRGRRVWLAFDVSATDTNLEQSEGFVVLLANAVRWLAGGIAPTGEYGFTRPIDAVGWQAWDRIDGEAGRPVGPLPWPGVYRNAMGGIHAIGLTGPPLVQPAEDPLGAVAAVELPPPEPAAEAGVFWPWLAGAAAALWIIGWWLRIEYR